jgi:hypothetical protein
MEPCGDSDPEDHDRQRDAGFDQRQTGPSRSERAAAQDTTERHHPDKRQRHQPQGATAELRREEADGEHHEHVIDAKGRMSDAVRKTLRVADPGMGVCRGGPDQERHERKSGARHFVLDTMGGIVSGGWMVVRRLAGKHPRAQAEKAASSCLPHLAVIPDFKACSKPPRTSAAATVILN